MRKKTKSNFKQVFLYDKQTTNSKEGKITIPFVKRSKVILQHEAHHSYAIHDIMSEKSNAMSEVMSLFVRISFGMSCHIDSMPELFMSIEFPLISMGVLNSHVWAS